MTESPLTLREFRALSDFRYQLRRFIRWSEELTHSHGVTNLQYLMLLHVKGGTGQGWATIGELAERLQSHHHGVVALVSRGVRLGLVRRVPGRADRRAVEVHLTAKGERLVGGLARLHRDELRRLRGVLEIPSVGRARRALASRK